VDELVRTERGAGTDRTPTLTPRESEVLLLVADGATNREIATALDVTDNTVSFHVKNILAKLHLKNRAQAAAYAVGSGLAEPPDRADRP
jgi:DNA-binding NarL/FixJ family response regulator